MKRPSHWIVVSLFGALTGCASMSTTEDFGPLTYRITGVVADSVPPGNYSFTDFTKTKITAGTTTTDLVKPVARTNRLQTDQAAKVNIHQQVSSTKTYDYTLLFGPPIGSGGTAIGLLAPTGDPAFILDSFGWVFAWRTWPIASTRWVSAAAQGSTIAIEQTDLAEAWVYYFGGAVPTMPVKCLRNPGMSIPPLNVDQFIIVTDLVTTCGVGAVQDIPLTDPGGLSEKKHAFDFRVAVKKIGTAAKWSP